MASLAGGAIDTTTTVRTMPEGTPLPPGIYQGLITRTAQKPTNDQSGMFVEVEFDIKAPVEFDGRKFWDRFNIVNQSADATRIGRECLADLGAAAGYPLLEDDMQLQGQQVLMELVVEPAKQYKDKNGVQRDGKAQNKCRKYWPLGTDIEAAKAAQKAAKAAQSGVAAPGPAKAAPAPAARPSWNNKAAAPAQVAQPVATVAQPVVQQPKPAAPTQPVAAPVATQPQAAQAAAPATNQAPWKRNKAQ